MKYMNKQKNGWLNNLIALLCGGAVLAGGRVTKAIVAAQFSLGETAPFLKGFLDFVYVRNRGGAWGVLSGKTALLLAVTAAIMIVCIVILVKFAKNSRLLFWAVVLVLSGGIGNMVDRIFYHGEVVDFLHFLFFPSFPVFNVADCAVVLGASLLILFFILDSGKSTLSRSETPNEQN